MRVKALGSKQRRRARAIRPGLSAEGASRGAGAGPAGQTEELPLETLSRLRGVCPQAGVADLRDALEARVRGEGPRRQAEYRRYLEDYLRRGVERGAFAGLHRGRRDRQDGVHREAAQTGPEARGRRRRTRAPGGCFLSARSSGPSNPSRASRGRRSRTGRATGDRIWRFTSGACGAA